MAQRLATEYMKAILEMDKSKLAEFIHLFAEKSLLTGVKVLENGDCEIILFDDKDQIPLTFKKINDYYQLIGSYRISDQELAGIMRKALKKFKGFAIVHRIYANFTMVYHYENGVVTRIAEKTKLYERVIYEFKNLVQQLTDVYQRDDAEKEIKSVKEEIDHLLDERTKYVHDSLTVQRVDTRLMELSHRLFVLED